MCCLLSLLRPCCHRNRAPLRLQIGIVGLPNVGKSTLFNTITKMGIPAENFPFCTIEPNNVSGLPSVAKGHPQACMHAQHAARCEGGAATWPYRSGCIIRYNMSQETRIPLCDAGACERPRRPLQVAVQPVQAQERGACLPGDCGHCRPSQARQHHPLGLCHIAAAVHVPATPRACLQPVCCRKQPSRPVFVFLAACSCHAMAGSVPMPRAKLQPQGICTCLEHATIMSCRGAAAGEGLGNSFLSHIAAVDGIFHVCRAFEDVDVVHVEDRVDPVADLEIIHGCASPLWHLWVLGRQHKQ